MALLIVPLAGAAEQPTGFLSAGAGGNNAFAPRAGLGITHAVELVDARRGRAWLGTATWPVAGHRTAALCGNGVVWIFLATATRSGEAPGH